MSEDRSDKSNFPYNPGFGSKSRNREARTKNHIDFSVRTDPNTIQPATSLRSKAANTPEFRRMLGAEDRERAEQIFSKYY